MCEGLRSEKQMENQESTANKNTDQYAVLNDVLLMGETFRMLVKTMANTIVRR